MQLASKQRRHVAVFTGGRHASPHRTVPHTLFAASSFARSGASRCTHEHMHADGSPPRARHCPSQSAVARQLIVPCGALPGHATPSAQLDTASHPSRAPHDANAGLRLQFASHCGSVMPVHSASLAQALVQALFAAGAAVGLGAAGPARAGREGEENDDDHEGGEAGEEDAGDDQHRVARPVPAARATATGASPPGAMGGALAVGANAVAA